MSKTTFYKEIRCWEGDREIVWNPPLRMSVYVYNIDGLLIDNGPLSLAEEIIPFFQAFPVEQAALTHLHEDHAGMSSWLQDKLHVPIYLHSGSLPEAAVEPVLADYRIKLWGRRRSFAAKAMPEQLVTDHYCLEVIDTPGHLEHHQVFLEKNQGWLFSGDLIVNVAPKTVLREEHMGQMIGSLQKVLKLDFGTVFCCHRGVLANGRAMLEEKLDYLLNLQDHVRAQRSRGMSDYDIAETIFTDNGQLGSMTQREFSSYYLVSTL